MKHLILFLFLIGTTLQSQGSVTVLNGLSHMYSGQSGEEIRGHVVLLNTSDQTERVRFELNEAIFSCDSSRVFTNREAHSQSSSAWFASDVMDKELAPNEQYIYDYSIHIPEDESLQGSYWTVLMVSVENSVSAEQLMSGVSIDSKVRYAIGLMTHVNAFDQVQLDFDDVELALDTLDYAQALDIRLKNDGQFIEGVSLILEVYDMDGEKVTDIYSDRNMVFPGVCKRYLMDISSLPDGEYYCLLLANARDEYAGTSISLTL
ncbi:hypothetical protein BFP72_00590 [Reichenbachiella sp. 5M10]|uniref:hypothetical protein n=1 Tax=Reichenbachiella sp. 5M10 TaxID=1889772 RepID=UPI000C14F3E6|nr:hypothetical protein [Reichenbachiella sp. 5M10]PIB34031.1 hypothetical protein BFP72_00590 [Reichenbachiella sp. 5M10]